MELVECTTRDAWRGMHIFHSEDEGYMAHEVIKRTAKVLMG
jgi:phage-related protein